MSRVYYVLTAIGLDRPGLVDAMSEYVYSRGGNVEAPHSVRSSKAVAVAGTTKGNVA